MATPSQRLITFQGNETKWHLYTIPDTISTRNLTHYEELRPNGISLASISQFSRGLRPNGILYTKPNTL